MMPVDTANVIGTVAGITEIVKDSLKQDAPAEVAQKTSKGAKK